MNDIILSLVITSNTTSSYNYPENTCENNKMERRLELVRSLLKANSFFDKVIKTDSISTLLSLNYKNTTATNTSDINDNDSI